MTVDLGPSGTIAAPEPGRDANGGSNSGSGGRPRTLAGALGAAAVDLSEVSFRLVAANALWGLAVLGVIVVSLGGGPFGTLVVAPLLAIPYAGVVRLATQTARRRDVAFSDIGRAYRRHVAATIALGAVTTVAVILLSSNLVIAGAMGGIAGVTFGSLAVGGLVIVWVASFPIWTILVDPARDERPVRERLRLAVLLVLAAPLRCAMLGAILALLLSISTVAFPALVTFAVAYAALVAARYLLPLSDRLEAWLADRARGVEVGRRPV